MADNARRGDWRPRMKAHPVTLRLDPDTYGRLRREAAESGWTLSAVMRAALAAGIEAVTADRVARAMLGGSAMAPAETPERRGAGG